jgi:predicted nucleotidyltransferase
MTRPAAAPDDLTAVLAAVEPVLRRHGARFCYLHGSAANETATPGSDVDVAAWFGRAVDSWVVAADLPDHVDLLVLDGAPLELAGRIAQHGQLLWEDDAAIRVAWQGSTRKVFLDERPRVEQARRDFVQGRLRG